MNTSIIAQPYHENEGLRQLLHLLSKEELKSFSRVDNTRFVVAFLMEIATIALTIAITEKFWSAPLYLIAVIIIGSRLHGLAVLVHDFAHYLCISNRKYNDILGEITALLLPISMLGFRKNHLAHHQQLNTDKDPDWLRTRTPEFEFPKPKSQVIALLCKYTFGFYVVRDIKQLGKEKYLNNIPRRLKIIRACFFAAVVCLSIAFGFWKGLILYWIIPFLTTFTFFLYIRSVSEHYSNLKYENLLNSARTVLATPLELWLFAPHGINYHIEHHLFPSVPFYRLKELHRYLMTKPIFAQSAHITPGYIRGLFRECCTP